MNGAAAVGISNAQAYKHDVGLKESRRNQHHSRCFDEESPAYRISAAGLPQTSRNQQHKVESKACRKQGRNQQHKVETRPEPTA